MADLISVADGAYPPADYGFLPATIKAWAGYVGGHTPHNWTAAEVAHLEATGRRWWGIWTAVQGRALTTADAQADAAGMLAGLNRLEYSHFDPVFYDVEYSAWERNPSQTEAAADHWCAIMRQSGYSFAYWYGPRDSTAQWRADWTGVPPASLPAGVVGIQYDHALSNDRYDISRFDASLLVPSGGTDMPLTATDLDAFWAHQVKNPTTGLSQSAAQRICDTQTTATHAADAAAQAVAESAALKVELDTIKTELDAIKTGAMGGPVTGVSFTIQGSGTAQVD